MLERAFKTFKNTTDRPTLIIVDSHIAYGAPNKQDTSAAHGEPLGKEEIKLAKRNYGWPEDAQFLVPDGVREHFRAGHRRARPGAARRLVEQVRSVQTRVSRARRSWLSHAAPRAAGRLGTGIARLSRRQQRRGNPGRVRPGVECARARTCRGCSAARRISAPSCKTRLTFEGAGDFNAENPAGRNLHFGIREHAMGAVLNGLSLSKIRPFGSGFLDLQRLRPRGDPAERLDGNSGHSHLHSRFHRRGRRRAHPSTGRTFNLVARYSRLDHFAAGGCR